MKKPHSALVLALWSMNGSCSPGPPLAISCNATYQGVYKDGVEAFLGVRYARDTGGENRFKPPKAYTPWPHAVVEATNIGPACPQHTGEPLLPLYLGNYTEVSEDCLRLNIFRPNGTNASDKLPVMVYIHGGSFIVASKDDPISQPGGLILQSEANGTPVMSIQINYRLGVFGFAQSAALKAEGSQNAGVRDQRLALEWVRDNVAAFGGDPENVLIHGQSSGGLAVGIQTVAFGASKPQVFRKVIGQSQILEGGITGNFTRDAMQRVVGQKCNTTSLDSHSTIACLRGLSTEDLLQTQLDTASTANIGDEWLPVVDGDFLPAAPSELLNTGRFYNVTTMIGWCEEDTLIFVDPQPQNAGDTRAFFRKYLVGFTEANLDKLLELYPESDFDTTYFHDGSVKLEGEVYRAGRILRDLIMTCQPIFFGRAMAEAGNDVYYYAQNQTITTPYLEANYSLYGYGVLHTSEMAYVFGNLSHYDTYDLVYRPRRSDYELAIQQSSSWASFASSGRPSADDLPTLQGWRKADFDDSNYGIYVVGGPNEGFSGVNGNTAARKAIGLEKLSERCGFLTSPEIVKQQQF